MSAMASRISTFVMQRNKGKENGGVFKLCNRISMMGKKELEVDYSPGISELILTQ